ncbi:MAG: DNA topoisomerase IB [Chloroflexi bacterium]|nr:MAG: DNA topoisomerase IB [Chloroflexota bacterium]
MTAPVGARPRPEHARDASADAADRPDPREAARQAGLRYASDADPGIRRVRRGKGFSYSGPDGEPIRDPETLARIRTLAVPPAWTDVWICRYANGHIQATGRDARRRKQHRYHPRWRETRDESKFDRMIEFAGALGDIRDRTDADLGRPGLPREKVLAAVVRLLELTLIRVGNDEYARLNRSFGLTTLRDRHARIKGTTIRFRFRGKSGQQHEVGLRDRRLASIVRRCQELPGQELFQYLDEDGHVRGVASDDVNEYLRDISGGDFTAKDFRTWAGTVLAYRALRALDPADSATDARRKVVAAMRETAGWLGNTPAVARKSYVHPAVVEAYMDGRVGGALVAAAEEAPTPPPEATPEEEAAVVDLLTQRLDDDARRGVPARPRRREPQKGVA